jgi:hypothetical protein
VAGLTGWRCEGANRRVVTKFRTATENVCSNELVNLLITWTSRVHSMSVVRFNLPDINTRHEKLLSLSLPESITGVPYELYGSLMA